MPLFLISLGIVSICIFALVVYMDKKSTVHNLMKDISSSRMNNEELKNYAEKLSAKHINIAYVKYNRKVIRNLKESYDFIIKCYNFLDKEVKDKNTIIPAGRWLLDNLYLIEKEYKSIKYNMPEAYYKDLPCIKEGILKGYPRVYILAVELISHSEGKVDGKLIMEFIKNYQKNTVLNSGELWAMPLMIKTALIQNISIISERIIEIQEGKKFGEEIGERIINASSEGNLKEEIQNIMLKDIKFTPFFTESLLKILRDNGIDNDEVYGWIDHSLKKADISENIIISREHKIEGDYKHLIENSINSIRSMEAMEWRYYFEELSGIEQILRDDPAEVYGGMDFTSRDYYRHEVENIAKKFKLPESYIASIALKCAEKYKSKDSNEAYKKHVGYYIIDDGKDELLKSLNGNGKFGDKLIMRMNKNPFPFYIVSIIVFTILVQTIFIYFSIVNDYKISLWKYIISFLVSLIPCSQIAISVLNWSITHTKKPSMIPKLELKDGIKEEMSSIVVIPTLLNSKNHIQELVEKLEVYYLGNPEKNLYFAILGDFIDSNHKMDKGDKELLDYARDKIIELNQKYSFEKQTKFFFLNRYRKKNTSEGKWMGWERKRGKLEEFNKLIRGSEDTSFDFFSHNIDELKKVKYVITLDDDTELPLQSVRKLVGAMEHILNKPIINNKKVCRGYGIIQPRVSITYKASKRSVYSKIMSGEIGLDVYTTAVSDVYQDIFKQGIFCGKGIYNVDVFNEILQGEIPENSILSHDLLEGNYLRTGLATDIELLDGYPPHFNSGIKRLHRWVRGDWQLLPWIKSKKIKPIGKWQMIDNLRRSLLTTSILLLIILSLTNVLPDGKDKWFTLSLISIFIPLLFNITENVSSPVKGISLSGKIKNNRMILEQIFLILCFLPYNAYIMVNAIVTTIYRMFRSKKNLLQWVSAYNAEKNSKQDIHTYIRAMWPASFIAVVVLALAVNKSTEMFLVFLLTCFIWFISPFIAYKISQEIVIKDIEIPSEKKIFLRRIARKTWAYFEDFVCEDTNWLGSDNFQEDPFNGLARRTSPTNMGMALTSNVSAYNLGYLGIFETVERIENVIESMEGLKKLDGHFYNWYDIDTKEPLIPRFISTVDSGNLVGYLWLVSSALNTFINKPVFSSRVQRGIADSVMLSGEELEGKIGDKESFSALAYDIQSREMDLISLKKTLNMLEEVVDDMERLQLESSMYWTIKLKSMIKQYNKEYNDIFSWLDYINDDLQEITQINSIIREISHSTPFNKLLIEFEKIRLIVEKDENYIDKDVLMDSINKCKRNITNFIKRVEELDKSVLKMAENTDFKKLYNKNRGLFSIGYDVEGDRLINSYYDLMASEARQASFVAIAKGDAPKDHWVNLGRNLTYMGKRKGLASWSGTMFEYFMPRLIMKNYDETLLDETYKGVIEGQIEYCDKKNVPFGISESAYFHFDLNLNYQYKAFGIPGVGLKRGLENELVVSPYSTILCMMEDFNRSYKNLKKLSGEGMEGKYGFYEAVDYSTERMRKGNKKEIVKCFMIHHEGMTFMALDNILNKDILVNTFHALPKIKAAQLLLQEKIPNRIVYDRERMFNLYESDLDGRKIISRRYLTPNTEIPEINLLGNGQYSVMIDNSGSGYSKLNDLFLYRWREDATDNSSGMYFYIRNLSDERKDYWSATYEPCKKNDGQYEVSFSVSKAEFKKKVGDILTVYSCTACREEDGEIRTISITNTGKEIKEIEVTSYSEATITSYDSDLVHPAFSNLFVTTEYDELYDCLLATRRPRVKGKKQYWVMHKCIVPDDDTKTQFETNRSNFIGRGRSKRNPIAMENKALTNDSGVVLDPILSLRKVIKINPGETKEISFITAITLDKETALKLAYRYGDLDNVCREIEIAYDSSQFEMKYLGLKSSTANIFMLLGARILYQSPLYLDRKEYIENLVGNQSTFWKYGISGDLPIVLINVKEDKDIEFIGKVIKAHEFLGRKGVKFDLVVFNNQQSSYEQPLQDALFGAINSSHLREKQNKSGGVFVRNIASVDKIDLEVIKAAARVVLDSSKGSIFTQIKFKNDKKEIIDYINYDESKTYHSNNREQNLSLPELEYFNGYGGFNLKNNSYVIHLKGDETTPNPWINVMSNGQFGTHVSEAGSSYTWCGNSRENKITPWNNDAVADEGGEYLYIRDEETGDLWSITAKPIRDNGDYLIEYGMGYSKFIHEHNGIYGNMTMFVPMNENTKICKITIKNQCESRRKLSLSYFAHMVMGVVPQHTSSHIYTKINKEKEYIYAVNPYSMHFNRKIAYLNIVGGKDVTFTGNRGEFIGRCGDVNNPFAMSKEKLSNSQGAGYDPCLCSNAKVELEVGESKEIIIILGEEEDLNNVEDVIGKYRSFNKANEELENVKEFWRNMCGRIQVSTPDKSMDILMNSWLIYQTLVCRIWARTAFYQSGGAFGFRDQLQDVMSFSFLEPDIARNHIIYSASKMFEEGDVQHWWHPGVESGIRTRFSDDLLWLPYVVCDYIENTSDYSVLDEVAPYLKGKPLEEDIDEIYGMYDVSDETGSIYDHCCRAIDRSLSFGSHGIPLMGSGDWNDGMSTVGNKGSGESVWLGWFLCSILNRFKGICEIKGDNERALKYEKMLKYIKDNLNEEAWDGEWFRRAYFDDGTPLGSKENEECFIDAIAQSWSIISECGHREKSEKAMESLEKYLVDYDYRLIKLLTPPFYKSDLEPGYIKGYVPGVRENGGQYTHAAVWVVYAFAKEKKYDKAFKLFNMINPVNHTLDKEACDRYKNEPYVMTADVYYNDKHKGRGGWSWYTGTSGWMYRIGIEQILGLKLKGDKGFIIDPCIPEEWNEYSIRFVHENAVYNIEVFRKEQRNVVVDGKELEGNYIPYYKEGEHKVIVNI